ncbi:hypothetical protein M0638_10095 [Roseomonas sp. NAR14]|uniref:Uncharacterized protein n=1 Tax=Roseomonas acroporae TaxID=2937791 RepID=A0A9X1Y7W8_9PROT|nr:hypothetical protein [Roseomonas acroporae]MCK8784732.1 hypothetical protein [Roseomonas acroporae]
MTHPLPSVAKPASLPRPAQPATVADRGRIRLGGGFKPAKRPTVPAAVADQGRIRLGGGFRANSLRRG